MASDTLPGESAPPETIPDLVARRASLLPDKVAFRDLHSGEALTFAGFEKRVQHCAGMLREAGVSAGDRIAILCRNQIEFFEVLFACAKLGAILLPLNWRMPASELAPLIARARPKLLLSSAEDFPAAATIPDLRAEVINLDDADDYPARRDASAPWAGRRAWPANECWYCLFTSGTTGLPKAVVQTYRMTIANYVNIRQGMSIGGNDVTLNYLPLFHAAGINLVTLPTFIEGGTSLVMREFDLNRTMEVLASAQIDTFFAVPAVYQQLSLHQGFDDLDLSRIRNFGCGGAPMPDSLIHRYLERGARVCNGMGMTETGPTVFLMDPGRVADKIGSVGKPQILAQVRIVNQAGEDVEVGEPGELLFAGPNVTPGYWQDPEATSAAMTRDGWLKSGDLGRCDEDGYYYIVGRIKDMFISGGENVYPAEVEKVLAAHSAILEAAVIGVPDEKWGETGKAFLLLKPGHEMPAAEALIEYCRERLAAYKVPQQFTQVRDFPRTAAGKIQKHLLGGIT